MTITFASLLCNWKRLASSPLADLILGIVHYLLFTASLSLMVVAHFVWLPFLYVPIHACSGPMSPSNFATQNFISYTEVSNNILHVHAATP